MTIPRGQAVRVVASSLCFDQDPPPVRSLDKARVAAAAIVTALAQAGMIDVTEDANGGGPVGGAAAADDQDALPLEG